MLYSLKVEDKEQQNAENFTIEELFEELSERIQLNLKSKRRRIHQFAVGTILNSNCLINF
jgi:hypothetical protein